MPQYLTQRELDFVMGKITALSLQVERLSSTIKFFMKSLSISEPKESEVWQYHETPKDED